MMSLTGIRLIRISNPAIDIQISTWKSPSRPSPNILPPTSWNELAEESSDSTTRSDFSSTIERKRNPLEVKIPTNKNKIAMTGAR